MQLRCLFASARSMTLCLDDGGLYNTARPYRLELNGRDVGTTDRVITSLYGLLPDTHYTVCAWDADVMAGCVTITTQTESYTLDVRRFGAIGDGLHDDTSAIQTAIVCCPPDGRVLLPRGTYLTGPLFLKSHIRVELSRGAQLRLIPDRSRMPILPGLTQSWDEQSELFLGTWEGNPMDSFAALVNGVDIEDVCLYGEGLLDGQGKTGGWWDTPKVKRGAWRGRLLFLCRCRDVTVQGLTFQNSPSWNIHPYFSQKLAFYGIHVTAPSDSPNTDGFDPESCSDVRLFGAHFKLGDDCVAIKSGKLYMGRKYQTPCELIEIAHCLMEDGHGGVTIGSEMAGGVKNVSVHHCLMRHTDRGLRIKTRRGRGKDGVVDHVSFHDLRMEGVKAPFTANALYFCDPDGHAPYVQSREPMPVDERTPRIGTLRFCRVDAQDCGVCAGYFLGLPEQPIERVELDDVRFTFAEASLPMQPVMADGVVPCVGRGLVVQNVDKLVLKHVRMHGQTGPALETQHVGSIEKEGTP